MSAGDAVPGGVPDGAPDGVPGDAVAAVMAQPPYTGVSYRALRADDALPPTLFLTAGAIPTTRDARVAAAVEGATGLLVLLDRTARDVSPLAADPTIGEVAVLPGAAFRAVGRFRPEGHDLDVLVTEEIVHESTTAPAPAWPHEGARIAELVSAALAGEGLGAPSAAALAVRDRYAGPMPVTRRPQDVASS